MDHALSCGRQRVGEFMGQQPRITMLLPPCIPRLRMHRDAEACDLERVERMRSGGRSGSRVELCEQSAQRPREHVARPTGG